MIGGVEDPRHVARRLIRFASGDVGAADPAALPFAIAVAAAHERLGSPEGELALARLVLHLGACPKSNSAHVARKQARAMAAGTGSLAPPAHVLNAPTALMRRPGRDRDHRCDHGAADGFSGQYHLPDGVPRRRPWRPAGRGAERAVAEHLARPDAPCAARRPAPPPDGGA